MKFTNIIAAVALMACGQAFAQYAPTKEGMKLTYKETVKEANKTMDLTQTVDKIETVDGLTTVTMTTELPQDNPLATPISISSVSASYKSADEPTTVYVMRGEDYKAMIINIAKESGQASPQQISEFEKMFQPKGDLVLVLDPKAEAGAKIPNSHMRVDMGMQAATMFLSKGKVEGFEDVTTEAGTFPNCIKVSYEERQTTPAGSEKSSVTEWYAKGIGSVKSIKADKKGEILEETVLVSIENK